MLDDGVRRDASMQNLAKLKPFFDRKYGNVTPGNSSQITDGAAWLILASEEALKKFDLNPIGRIVDSEWAGLDPATMGLGPVHAATPILKRHNLGLDDVDYWEINEAFAAQVLAVLRKLKTAGIGAISDDSLNVNGGAIALGHPVGASGARLVLTALKELRRRDRYNALVSLCVGGGQGAALWLKRS
jgi:acetyl-CoA C-acetyltransferase